MHPDDEDDRFEDLPGAFARGPVEGDEVEVVEEVDDLERPAMPSRVASWSRSSFAGAVMTGFALGLREVLEVPKDDEIVIEVDADGQPYDLPVRVMLDPDSPQGSLCIVRRDPPPPVV